MIFLFFKTLGYQPKVVSPVWGEVPLVVDVSLLTPREKSFGYG